MRTIGSLLHIPSHLPDSLRDPITTPTLAVAVAMATYEAWASWRFALLMGFLLFMMLLLVGALKAGNLPSNLQDTILRWYCRMAIYPLLMLLPMLAGFLLAPVRAISTAITIVLVYRIITTGKKHWSNL